MAPRPMVAVLTAMSIGTLAGAGPGAAGATDWSATRSAPQLVATALPAPMLSAGAGTLAEKATAASLFAGGTKQAEPAYLVVASTAAMHGTALATCTTADGHPTTLTSADLTGISVTDGHYDATGQGSTSSGGVTTTFTDTAEGTIAGPSVSGTFKVHFVKTRGSTTVETCDTGAVAWSGTSTGAFGGTDLQGFPVEGHERAGSLRHFRVGWFAPCGSGGDFLDRDDLGAKVTDGSFKRRLPTETLDLGHGFVAKENFTLAGQVASPGQLVGHFVATVALLHDGVEQTTCQTGTVSWQAAA